MKITKTEQRKAVEQLETIIGKLEWWQVKYETDLDQARKAGDAKSRLIELLDRIQ